MATATQILRLPLHLLAWPFRALGRLHRHRMQSWETQYAFHQYPLFVFTWLLIIAGFALYPVAMHGWLDSETLAWVWGIILIVTVLALGVDLDRDHVLFTAAIVALLFALIKIARYRESRFFTRIHDFFAQLDPQYSPTLGLMISIILSVAFVIMLIKTRLDSKWIARHNTLDHQSWGRADDSLARGAKRTRTSYPDAFQFILGLAGTLHVYDANGNRELRRIENVLFLPWVKRRVDHLWESTQVAMLPDTIDDEAAAGDHEEADASAAGGNDGKG
jgi:hypothetical protein